MWLLQIPFSVTCGGGGCASAMYLLTSWFAVHISNNAEPGAKWPRALYVSTVLHQRSATLLLLHFHILSPDQAQTHECARIQKKKADQLKESRQILYRPASDSLLFFLFPLNETTVFHPTLRWRPSWRLLFSSVYLLRPGFYCLHRFFFLYPHCCKKKDEQYKSLAGAYPTRRCWINGPILEPCHLGLQWSSITQLIIPKKTRQISRKRHI